MWSGIWSVICDLQQLEWAFELEPDLQDTMDWGRKWLVNFNAGKAQLILLDRSNNTGAIDVKIDGLLLTKYHLRCWGVHFYSKLDWGFDIISIAKTASKKIGPLILSMKFLSPEVAPYLYILCGHAWNTVVMSRLVLLVAAWNCWISCKNGYAWLLVLQSLPLLNPKLIVKM